MSQKVPSRGNIRDRSDGTYDRTGDGYSDDDEFGKKARRKPQKVSRRKDSDQKGFKPRPDDVEGSAEKFDKAYERIAKLNKGDQDHRF